ncbi:MAG: TetR/AcrR family transcriptional regulator [Deltaproteobacteria bacterium]|nr:TetR/AcrR family transcriptional regulator [Deltaproteobacteria bacterium]
MRVRSPERRAQILETAVKTFARLGYERASIAEVCADAGIARGTLYQYFADKQALFREVLRAYAGKVATHMQPLAPAQIPSAPDREGLLDFLTERFERIYSVILDEREIYTILFREALAKNADTRDVVAEIHGRLVSLMVAEMEMGRRLGLVRVEESAFAAEFLIGGIFHTALVCIVDAPVPQPPRLLAEKSARFVVGALSAPRP